MTIIRTPYDSAPRTDIPWVRNDHHDCPDKRSSNKSLRIRADGYAKCFRCGWKGWLDGPTSTAEEIQCAVKKQESQGRVIDRIVRECIAIPSGSPVERYLAKRRLTQPWPDDLRYHQALWHGPSKQKLPAMVALLRDAKGAFTAIHRTFLTDAGDKAAVDPVRMVLGRTQNSAFHAPMLPTRTPDGTLVYKAGHSQPRTTICVCEGIEDALALRLLYPGYAAWATISAENMGSNEPPAVYPYVLIFPDADRVGKQAGLRLHELLALDLDQNRVDQVAAVRAELDARRAAGEELSLFMEDHLRLDGRVIGRTPPNQYPKGTPIIEPALLRRQLRGPRSSNIVWLHHAKDPAEEWYLQQEARDAGT